MKTNLKSKALWLCTLFFVCITLHACKDDIEESKGELDVTPLSIENVNKDGVEETIEVKSNCYWSVKAVNEDGSTASWITISSNNGMGNSTITLTIAKNSEPQSRQAKLIISSADETKQSEVLISQLPGESTAKYDLPIYAIFTNVNNSDASLGIANGSINGNIFKFDEGIQIEQLNGNSQLSALWYKTYYEVALMSTGWDAANCAWLITIPVNNELKGDLRLMNGMRTSESTSWKVEWSNDNKQFFASEKNEYTASTSSRWKYTFFTIDEAHKIPAKGNLYIRISPSAAISSATKVYFDSGICLSEAKPAQSVLPTGDKVLYTWGFDDTSLGGDYMLPIWYMSSADGSSYAPSDESGLSCTATYERPGYVKIGTSKSAGALTLPALSKLGNATSADVKVSFKSCLYTPATETKTTNAVGVRVKKGNGTPENDGKITNINDKSFTENSVIVKGVNASTVLEIASTSTESIDTRFFVDDIVVEIVGDPIYPSQEEPVMKEICNIRDFKTNLTSSSTSYNITENWKVKGVIASDPSTSHLAKTDFAIVCGNNPNSGIFVRMPSEVNWTIGDEIEIAVKNAKLQYIDGLLYLEPEAAKVTKTETPNARPTEKAISAAELTTGYYEGMPVSLSNVQVVLTDLSKFMEGSVQMETSDKKSFSMFTSATATFKAQKVPQLNGTIKGIAGNGAKLMIRNTADLEGMTMERFGKENVKPFTPIIDVFKYNESGELTNGTISDGKKFTFTSNNASIEFVGGSTADMTYGFAGTTYYNNYIKTSGWERNGAYWLFTIPTEEAISGQMQFSFGMVGETANAPKNWKAQWSNNNKEWNDVDNVYVTTSATGSGDANYVIAKTSSTFKKAIFTVPASKKINAGGALYIRLIPTDYATPITSGNTVDNTATVRISSGFYVAAHGPSIYNYTELASGDNVILSEGFDNCVLGFDYFANIGYIASQAGAAFTAPAGWTTSVVSERPGYVFMGRKASVTTPKLSQLGTDPTTITLKFKACIYLPATGTADNNDVTIEVIGAGTIEKNIDTTVLDNDYSSWHDLSATITGATQETQIIIRTDKTSTSGRFFLDDIVITK